MLSMGYMDCMRIFIVSFESFDEGLSSLEAVFNLGQVPGLRFVSDFLTMDRLSQHLSLTRGQHTFSLTASENASRKHNVSDTGDTVRTWELSGRTSPCVSDTLGSFVQL